MIIPRCPTCNRLLADKQIPYQTGLKKICGDKNTSEKTKMQQKQKLLDDLGLTRYCCRTRMIGYLNQVRLLI